MISPGAYLHVTVDDDSEAGFGLGRADEIRIFLADGATLVDRFAWTDHASTSYGLCGDAFIVMPVSTPGAANVCAPPVDGNVVVNEIDPAGWVELTSTGSLAVDVSGVTLANASGDPLATVPDGTTIEPGAFLRIPAEGAIDLSGGTVRLVDGADEADAQTFAGSAVVGRCPDGVGFFEPVRTATPAAANDCTASELPAVVVNEVETSNGVPGDWIEFVNIGETDVDLSGFVVRDSDDSHVAVIPDGSVIPAGGFWVAEESFLGYGLGVNDSARLYLPGGFTLVDEHVWSAVPGGTHAPTTFGRCPDGTGDWTVTTAPTKGAANDCSSPVRLNEIESSGDAAGDWVELVNLGASPIDISGYTLTDTSSNGPLTIPAGTTLAAGAYLQVIVEPAFGLGGNDAVTLADATDAALDSTTWTSHADATWARCPDGTGAFGQSEAATPGAVNACAGDVVAESWPGAATVTVSDPADLFTSDMSGLAFSASGDTLWAVDNGRGILHRLVRDGAQWSPAPGWTGGATLRYPSGSGTVDAEGVVAVGAEAFVAAERDNSASGVSRPSILRYTPGAAAGELTATGEWNLVGDLPTIGANAGLEGIAWIPDAALVAGGFTDETTGAVYDPSRYPGHGEGLFFVGLEANGTVYAYALDLAGDGFTRVATVDSGFPAVMELEYDAASGALWALCDDTCDGRSAVLELTPLEDGATQTAFTVTRVQDRPADMPNLNKEGFALSPVCADGFRTAVWADDGDTGGHSLRDGSVDCTDAGEEPTPTPTPTPTPGDGGATPTPSPSSGAGGAGTTGSDPALAVTGAEASTGLLALGVLLSIAGLAAAVIARLTRASRGV